MDEQADLLALVVSATILAVMCVAWCLAKNRKNKKIDLLAHNLQARRTNNGFTGQHEELAYMVHFSEGHPGGSVKGPTRSGSKSYLHILVEVPGETKFSMSPREDSYGSPRTELNRVASQLFSLRFNEIEYDGMFLSVKRSPASLDEELDKEFFRKALDLTMGLAKQL